MANPKRSLTINVDKTGAGTASGTVKLNTAGTFVDYDIVVDVDATAQLGSNANGSLTKDPVTGQSYTEQTIALDSGGSLYINEGFYPNLRVPLSAMLVDDSANANAAASHIRSGYEAYSVTGTKLVGTMADVNPTFSGGGITFDTTTTTTAAAASIASTGTLKTATSYGVTTTKPSGTDGTDYFTIDGTISKTDGVYVAKAKRGAVTYAQAYAGYLNKASGAAALSAQTSTTDKTVNATVGTTDNFAPIYVKKGSWSASLSGVSLFNYDGTRVDDSAISGAVEFTSSTGGPSWSGEAICIVPQIQSSATAGMITAKSASSSSTYYRAYMKKVSPTAISGLEVTNPTVTITGSVSASSGVSTSGVLSSAPSSGKYLTINGTYVATNGSADATATANCEMGFVVRSAGAFEESTDSSSSAIAPTVTNNSPKYIKVYDGTYTTT